MAERAESRVDPVINALTFDVEDYYHVRAFQAVIRPEDWNTYEPRVYNNTLKIIELLAPHGIQATFFVLGWVAEQMPDVVKEIQSAGHEIGSHGYGHQLIYDQTPDEFAADLRRSLDVIEGITGSKVRGFRAPSFSVTRGSFWAIEIMRSFGITYDSSVFPILHDNYGIPDAPRHPYEISKDFWEFPMTTVRIFGQNIPIAGGAYLRVFPYWLTRWGIRQINSGGEPAIVYLHPWELDPEHPRIEASALSRFRHYANLDKTTARLGALCEDFKFTSLQGLLQELSPLAIT
ncbi:MAG TPA: XrtA system polysaccharide deacetylase [Pyrinomonadaceae bacterium]|nr:XrtA system polysaccharide deacetylase [Pyrinomonadaceae bacterium]